NGHNFYTLVGGGVYTLDSGMTWVLPVPHDSGTSYTGKAYIILDSGTGSWVEGIATDEINNIVATTNTVYTHPLYATRQQTNFSAWTPTGGLYFINYYAMLNNGVILYGIEFQV